jgi:uncharacterized protein (TIGR03437 family)
MGSGFQGGNLMVTLDGAPAQVLSSSDNRIDLLVPGALAAKASAQLAVVVNGSSSAPQQIALAPFAPGIFADRILNQDNSVNGSAQPAAAGTIIKVFATGLSGNGAVTARIGDYAIDVPAYAGPADHRPGVQEVDLMVPLQMTDSTANVSVCGGLSSDQMVCSPAVQVAISPQTF